MNGARKNIKPGEIARQSLRLEKIMARQQLGHGFDFIVLRFEGGVSLGLRVNQDTDELLWESGDQDAPIELSTRIPKIAEAYGLHLTWSWEMTNHQGYFDALQLELGNPGLTNAVILQFKAAASAIRIFTVEPTTTR